jgi:hypothetical protein
VVLDLTFASMARGDTEANVKSTTLGVGPALDSEFDVDQFAGVIHV